MIAALGLRLRRWRGLIPELCAPDGERVAQRGSPRVDVVLPLIEKDLALLPLVLQGLRKHLDHPLGKIHLVAPDRPALREAAARNGCAFRDEDTVLPVRSRDIRYRSARGDRSGWIFQQFLKWADSPAETEFYFVIDADTILNRPRAFRRDGKTLFLSSDEFHLPYRKMFERLLGFRPPGIRSFVAHQMLFEKSKTARLRAEIEARAGRPWHEEILRILNEEPALSFSEFETYGNWHLERFPEETEIRNWGNIARPRGSFDLERATSHPLLRRFWSYSLHSYLD